MDKLVVLQPHEYVTCRARAGSQATESHRQEAPILAQVVKGIVNGPLQATIT